MTAIMLFSCARRLLGRLNVQAASTRKLTNPAVQECPTIASPESEYGARSGVDFCFIRKLRPDHLVGVIRLIPGISWLPHCAAASIDRASLRDGRAGSLCPCPRREKTPRAG